jgi:hypothetical protein
MFSPMGVLIDAFCAESRRGWGALFPDAPTAGADRIEAVARTALEILANTDAPYHDLEHTLLVTTVGQQILRGRQLADGDVAPDDWLHFTLSLLFHDIGYVRGICRGDRGGRYVTGPDAETVKPPPGATDAWMTPWHVDRGQIFVRERFAADAALDVERLCRNIERTRFPVPSGGDHAGTRDEPGLVRAADLIGQLADPRYLQKLARLYMEFRETGEAERLGYDSPADLRAAYPAFFWNVVSPYIGDGVAYLRRTQDGQQTVAHLFGHVFEEEHEAPAYGPERRAAPDRRSEDAPPPTDEERRRRGGGRRATDRSRGRPRRRA